MAHTGCERGWRFGPHSRPAHDVAFLEPQTQTVHPFLSEDFPEESRETLLHILDDVRDILLTGARPFQTHAVDTQIQLHSMRALPDMVGGRRSYSALYLTNNGEVIPVHILGPAGRTGSADEGVRHLLNQIHWLPLWDVDYMIDNRTVGC